MALDSAKVTFEIRIHNESDWVPATCTLGGDELAIVFEKGPGEMKVRIDTSDLVRIGQLIVAVGEATARDRVTISTD